jgi:hypothetical protein
MGKNSIRVYSEKVYLESGNWKCEKSPTGAHHWFILQHQMTCQHCSLIRELDDPQIKSVKNHTN